MNVPRAGSAEKKEKNQGVINANAESASQDRPAASSTRHLLPLSSHRLKGNEMATTTMSSLSASDSSGSNNGRDRSSNFSVIAKTGWLSSSSDPAFPVDTGNSFLPTIYGGSTLLSSSIGAFAPSCSPSSFLEMSYLARQEQLQSQRQQYAPVRDGTLLHHTHTPTQIYQRRDNNHQSTAFQPNLDPGAKTPQETINKYATYLLQRNSPEEVRSSIDESLGPYITSILVESTKRVDLSYLVAEEDASNLIDYENVLELILEHCSMTSRDVASQTLQEIYRAVRTGTVPLQFTEREKEEEQRRMFQGILDSMLDDSSDLKHQQQQQQTNQEQDVDTQQDMDNSELELLVGQMMLEEEDNDEEGPKNSQSVPQNKGGQDSNSLLPSYLLADVDDENAEANDNSAIGTTTSNSPTSTSIGELSNINKSHPPRPWSSSTKEQKKRSKAADDVLAKDLAAALFKPSRPRSNSNLSDTTGKRNSTASPRLLPQANLAMSTTPPMGSFTMESGYYSSSPQHQYVAQQIDATAELLLSMQSDLSPDAASTASMMAYGDFNVAYYLIEQALNASPVCRHMLQYACYRADCAFSHDVDGHTCSFWLRGRCGKGDQCRFLHGFNQALLEGVDLETLNSGGVDQRQEEPSSGPGAIVTQNLLRHNEKRGKDSVFGSSGSPCLTSSPPSGLDPEFSSFSLPKAAASKSESSNISVMSFAKIAASNNLPSVASTLSLNSSPLMGTSSNVGKQKEKTTKIPQELWTSSVNRDSSVFHIADPIERYNAVNNPQNRAKQAAAGLPYVMDLHYQSVKTVPVVLASLLPQKLEESKLQQERGVWIVTGSGHHVNIQSHQKRNGVLESAVLKWLQDEGYEFFRGKDRNGHGGAIYVTGIEIVR